MSKRRRGDQMIACSGDVEVEKFNRFLQTRERMLREDPVKHGLEDGKGLHLINLLLNSATAVDQKNTILAADLLREIYQHASVNGDSIQRVAVYFADGLAAKLLTKRSPFYRSIMDDTTQEQEFSTVIDLYRFSPYIQFGHFILNQAILEAFEEEEKKGGSRNVHVVDFDVSYGFQWPSLIQSFSDKATSSKPISLQISGFDQNIEQLRGTENRLVNFSKGYPNLAFEFEALLYSSGRGSVRTKGDAIVVVNLISAAQSMSSSSEITATLKRIQSFNPSLVTLMELEGRRSPINFVSRYTESLHYYATVFDSMEDCLPADSSKRLNIEKHILGREIKSIISRDKAEVNPLRYQTLQTWKRWMKRIGFKQVKLSSMSMHQAKLLLKKSSHSASMVLRGDAGFHIIERDEGRGVTLAWKGTHLITSSVWRRLP